MSEMDLVFFLSLLAGFFVGVLTALWLDKRRLVHEFKKGVAQGYYECSVIYEQYEKHPQRMWRVK